MGDKGFRDARAFVTHPAHGALTHRVAQTRPPRRKCGKRGPEEAWKKPRRGANEARRPKCDEKHEKCPPEGGPRPRPKQKTRDRSHNYKYFRTNPARCSGNSGQRPRERGLGEHGLKRRFWAQGAEFCGFGGQTTPIISSRGSRTWPTTQGSENRGCHIPEQIAQGDPKMAQNQGSKNRGGEIPETPGQGANVAKHWDETKSVQHMPQKLSRRPLKWGFRSVLKFG